MEEPVQQLPLAEAEAFAPAIRAGTHAALEQTEGGRQGHGPHAVSNHVRFPL
jgi:hypothetical protein